MMAGAELYRLEPLCLQAYCEGLAYSGTDVPDLTVRRGHAASMALFAGLQAVPSQRLAEPDSEELRTFMAGRVEMARFVRTALLNRLRSPVGAPAPHTATTEQPHLAGRWARPPDGFSY